MLDAVRSGLWVTDLITHRDPFAQANTAFAYVASGQPGKVILVHGA